MAHLRTLREVSRKLNSKLDLEGVLTGVLDETIRAVGAERGCLLLANSTTGELEVHLSRRLRPSELTKHSFGFSRTVIERVWREGEPILTADALKDPELAEADSVINYALRSILCVPLHLHTARIGVLYLDNRLRIGQFQEDDLALAVAIADQAAIALQNAQLHAELQQRLAEMQSVLAITRALVSEIGLNNLLEFIITQSEHLTNAEGAAVLLLDKSGKRLEVASPGESWLPIQAGSGFSVQGSLAERALTSQQVQISNQAQADVRVASERALLRPVELRSLLCAPLVVHNESLGVLLVWNKRDQIFTANDRRLMGLFADQAALALYNARLHDRNRRLAVEQERHRLARELHDSVTQSLYSIGLAAQTSLKLLDQPNSQARLRDPLEHILKLSRAALAEMREQLHDLYPTALSEAGLVQVLADHCRILKRQYALPLEFQADEEPPLSMVQRKALYYIAREALWNVVKHADATQVEVRLRMAEGQVVLSVTDDGVGFDPLTAARKGTIGLRSMEERTKLLGGVFRLQSKPGGGTRVTAQIPVAPDT